MAEAYPSASPAQSIAGADVLIPVFVRWVTSRMWLLLWTYLPQTGLKFLAWERVGCNFPIRHQTVSSLKLIALWSAYYADQETQKSLFLWMASPLEAMSRSDSCGNGFIFWAIMAAHRPINYDLNLIKVELYLIKSAATLQLQGGNRPSGYM